MDLLKYFPVASIGKTIECSRLQSLYVFNGFTLTDQIPCGIFLTSNDFYRPDLAQDKLAITYRPKLEAKIDNSSPFNVFKNYGSQISSSSSDDTLSRVWPVFGYTGGAYEYIFKCDNCDNNQGKQISGIRRTYPTGGLKDFFHGKAVRLQNFNSTADKMSGEIIQMLNPIFTDYEKNRKIVKFQENGFILAIFSYLPEEPNISIPLGMRNLSRYSVCNLWASLWIDDLTNRTREVYGHVQRACLFKQMNVGNQISKDVNSLLTEAITEFQRGTLVVRRGLVLP